MAANMAANNTPGVVIKRHPDIYTPRPSPSYTCTVSPLWLTGVNEPLGNALRTHTITMTRTSQGKVIMSHERQKGQTVLHERLAVRS
jgi:hypothetical protein